MGKVTIDIDAEDAKAVQAWQRQKSSFIEFNDALRSMHTESHTLSERFLEDIEGWGKGLAATYVGFEGVKKVAESVVEAYHREAEELHEVVQRQRESREELTHMLALSGKLRDTPLVEKGLGEISEATKAERKAAFGGIAEAAPELGTAGQLSLTKAIAPMAEVLGEEGMGQFARIAATLKRAAPDRTDFDVANLANVAVGQAGGRRGELADPATVRALEILQGKAGMSAERALGFETEALSHGLQSRDLEKIADALVGDLQIKHPHTAQDLAYNRFVHAGKGQERLGLLMHDEKVRQAVLGGREAERFGLMSEAGISHREAALAAGHGGAGSIESDLAEWRKTHATDVAVREAKLKKERAEQVRATTGGEDEFEAGQAMEEAEQYRQHPNQSVIGRMLFHGGQSLDRLLHYTIGGRAGLSSEALDLRNRRNHPEIFQTAVERQHEHALAAAANPQFQMADLNRTNQLLEQLVAKDHAPRVHVQVAAPRPRINDVGRADPSPSSQLALNH